MRLPLGGRGTRRTSLATFAVLWPLCLAISRPTSSPPSPPSHFCMRNGLVAAVSVTFTAHARAGGGGRRIGKGDHHRLAVAVTHASQRGVGVGGSKAAVVASITEARTGGGGARSAVSTCETARSGVDRRGDFRPREGPPGATKTRRSPRRSAHASKGGVRGWSVGAIHKRWFRVFAM